MEERRHTGRNIDGEGEPQQCRTVVSGVAAVAVETADGRGPAEGGDEDVGRFEVSVYDTFGIERPVHFGHALQQTAEDGGSVTVEVGADEIGEPEGTGGSRSSRRSVRCGAPVPSKKSISSYRYS